jgi:hypothetical protein
MAAFPGHSGIESGKRSVFKALAEGADMSQIVSEPCGLLRHRDTGQETNTRGGVSPQIAQPRGQGFRLSASGNLSELPEPPLSDARDQT